MAEDELDTILQRMIDAGESEDAMAAVIQDYEANPPYQSRDVMAEARRSANSSGLEGEDTSFLGGLNKMLHPLAHPESLSDFAGLLIPDFNLGGILRAGGRGTQTAGRAIEAVGNSPKVERLSELGSVGELALKGDVTKAVGAAALPATLRGGGWAMQRGGAALERAASQPSTGGLINRWAGRLRGGPAVPPSVTNAVEETAAAFTPEATKLEPPRVRVQPETARPQPPPPPPKPKLTSKDFLEGTYAEYGEREGAKLRYPDLPAAEREAAMRAHRPPGPQQLPLARQRAIKTQLDAMPLKAAYEYGTKSRNDLVREFILKELARRVK